jgi:hypothetical protein
MKTMFKKSFLVLISLLLCLSFTSCTKKPVRPNSINNPEQSVTETDGIQGSSGYSGTSEGINLLTSAKGLVNGIFSAFGKTGKAGKGFSISKGQAATAAIIGGAVVLGLLVLYQNRPKKYAASKGKYQG